MTPRFPTRWTPGLVSTGWPDPVSETPEWLRPPPRGGEERMGSASDHFRAAPPPLLARRPKPASRPDEPPRRGRPRAGDAGPTKHRAPPFRHTAPGAPGTALPPQKGRTATLIFQGRLPGRPSPASK